MGSQGHLFTPVYLDCLVLGPLRDWAEPAVDKPGVEMVPCDPRPPWGVGWECNDQIHYEDTGALAVSHCQGTNTCTLKARIQFFKKKIFLYL